ncbi:MAG TPA: hypothetical protein VM677_34700 [Actinokineospora sp.]|jgi:hypothetical protein|nr:hypothetical protein [Actinokineospora sp.]
MQAIAAMSGTANDDVEALFREMIASSSDTGAASEEEATAAVEALRRRLQLAPVPPAAKEPPIAALAEYGNRLPALSIAQIRTWERLVAELPLHIVTVEREPVRLPPFTEEQAAAWHAVLDLDEHLSAHWCLIGGQLVTFVGYEYGRLEHRATDDGDVVLGVWTHRGALREASTLLRERGFVEVTTSDAYGYRYQRGEASIDLLLPEEAENEKHPPTTVTGRPGFVVPGGNQALIRAERVPVRLETRDGHVRRPRMLGAIVAKAAASVVDHRDPDRHRDDLVTLGDIALANGLFRDMQREAGPKDRKRLRTALEQLPLSHRAWRSIPNSPDVHTALTRLAKPNP